MKLVDKGWAVVDSRWRILYDPYGSLIFQKKSDAEKYQQNLKQNSDIMVVEAQIFFPEGFEEEMASITQNQTNN